MAKILTEVGAIDLETFVPPMTTITGQSYTVGPDDIGRRLLFTNAAAVTVTIPNEAVIKSRGGGAIVAVQMGAGKVSFAAGTGVTLNGPGAAVGTSAQYAEIKATKNTANVWIVGGSVG